MNMQSSWSRVRMLRAKRSRGLKDERGDTIVEVLIAVAIVSLVLTSAYAVTNRNVGAIQEAQEQAYAQKLVQEQVEYLRKSPILADRPGCYQGASSYVQGAGCEVTNGGAVYTLNMKESAGTYTVTATWQTIAGNNATVTVYYRAAA